MSRALSNVVGSGHAKAARFVRQHYTNGPNPIGAKLYAVTVPGYPDAYYYGDCAGTVRAHVAGILADIGGYRTVGAALINIKVRRAGV